MSDRLRASGLLRVPAVWALPVAVTTVLVFGMTLAYLGSVVDPAAHLHGLPVAVVDQDAGATEGAVHLDVGRQVTAGLVHTRAVTSRLALDVTTMAGAEAAMDDGRAYAAIVVPATFTRSLLVVAGRSPAGTAPVTPSIRVLLNQRLGTIGADLAEAVAQQAIAAISHQLAAELRPLATAGAGADPVHAAALADPVSASAVPYRPLPAHSALGLSAFYMALLALLGGVLSAIIVNSSGDAVLGFAATEVGPRWRQRPPAVISRWQTLVLKWVMAAVIVPVLMALVLVAAAGILRMDAPHVGELWLFTSFAAVSVAAATLVLFAALGTLGQVVTLLVFVYLALGSSGGTVPVQAEVGFFRLVSHVEPLRQVLDGTRAILYFGARGGAGLDSAVGVIGVELVVWLVLGVAVTGWYDHRGFHRVEPGLARVLARLVHGDEGAAAAVPVTAPAVAVTPSAAAPIGTADDPRTGPEVTPNQS